MSGISRQRKLSEFHRPTHGLTFQKRARSPENTTSLNLRWAMRRHSSRAQSGLGVLANPGGGLPDLSEPPLIPLPDPAGVDLREKSYADRK